MLCKLCKKEMSSVFDYVNHIESWVCKCGAIYRVGLWYHPYKKIHPKGRSRGKKNKKTQHKMYKKTKNQRIYKRYKKGAVVRGVSFDLDMNTFFKLKNDPCYYCGHPAPNGIDRVNSGGGYTNTNTVPCCYICNLMKRKMGKFEFLAHIKKICLKFKLSK